MVNNGPVEIAMVGFWRVEGGSTEILIARRGPDGHLPGLWELPGGKVESGETCRQAAAREAKEETGLMPLLDALDPLPVVRHAYEERTVELNTFLCPVRRCKGCLKDDGQSRRWVRIADLFEVAFPEANGPLTAEITSRLSDSNYVESHW